MCLGDSASDPFQTMGVDTTLLETTVQSERYFSIKLSGMVGYSYHCIKPYMPPIGEYAEYYQCSQFERGQLPAFRDVFLQNGHSRFTTLIKSALPMLKKL